MTSDEIKSYLEEEGFRPRVDDDKDIQFKFEGSSYFIEVNSDDETYLRVVYPYFWSLEDADEEVRALRCGMEATQLIKVAKIYIVKKGVWASAEFYIDDIDYFKRFLMRWLRALKGIAQEFERLMRDK